HPCPTLFPYTTLFRSRSCRGESKDRIRVISCQGREVDSTLIFRRDLKPDPASLRRDRLAKSIGPLDYTHPIVEDGLVKSDRPQRSEEHTSELQSPYDL